MLLKIDHTTQFDFGRPIEYGLQRLRVFPSDVSGQSIVSWNVTVEGGNEEVRYTDHHQNLVALYSYDTGTEGISIQIKGAIETEDMAGVIGRHRGFAPLWYYSGTTALTTLGTRTRSLIRTLGSRGERDDISFLHDLSALIGEQVTYQVGVTEAHFSAEDALAEGAGVCQDHAHIFITAARAMGYPARYISGYLFMDGQIEQDATHAWAEAHVPDLGWVGFDVSNKISPDERYVRIAAGLDYKDAAPTTGLTYGAGEQKIDVALRVEQ